MRLIDIEAPYKVEIELDGEKCHATVTAQTVDAVPVVRCGECKHSKPWYKDKYRCFFWVETGVDVFEDGFCSYGKPKGGDK